MKVDKQFNTCTNWKTRRSEEKNFLRIRWILMSSRQTCPSVALTWAWTWAQSTCTWNERCANICTISFRIEKHGTISVSPKNLDFYVYSLYAIRNAFVCQKNQDSNKIKYRQFGKIESTTYIAHNVNVVFASGKYLKAYRLPDSFCCNYA